ncbi:hypothetical protein JG688_00018332 [Phytophthora aleatoria]|uniref:Uncharacterized protein n=1 Tax=Phytophthora aleatoria TaxID=2496075 RepID=A0A8J5IPL8_9STRA|nr:hypothetical protein JG688_00018332 [Phytophthora aleatoria]
MALMAEDHRARRGQTSRHPGRSQERVILAQGVCTPQQDQEVFVSRAYAPAFKPEGRQPSRTRIKSELKLLS